MQASVQFMGMTWVVHWIELELRGVALVVKDDAGIVEMDDVALELVGGVLGTVDTDETGIVETDGKG